MTTPPNTRRPAQTDGPGGRCGPRRYVGALPVPATLGWGLIGGGVWLLWVARWYIMIVFAALAAVALALGIVALIVRGNWRAQVIAAVLLGVLVGAVVAVTR